MGAQTLVLIICVSVSVKNTPKVSVSSSWSDSVIGSFLAHLSMPLACYSH